MATTQTGPLPIAKALEVRKRDTLKARIHQWPRTQPVASDLDPNSCLRRQVLEVVAWRDKPLPDPEAAERMEAGIAEEARSVRLLEDMGIRVVRQQEPFELLHRRTGRKCVGGKLDGVITFDGIGYVLESKLVSTWAFDATETAADFNERWWSRKYLSQLNTYQVGLGLEWGLFMLSDGRRRKWLPPVPLDLDLAERAWSFAEEIQDAIDRYREAEARGSTSLPPFTKDAGQCARCPFFRRTCQPTLDAGGTAEFIADEEDEAALERWWELRPMVKEYNSLDKQLKARLKVGATLKIVGDFIVELKPVHKDAETVPREAQNYFAVHIDKLGARE